MANEHILVVEDEEDILELLRYNLTKEGFRVTGATSGEEALRSARTLLPDLVLLDLMLPGMDGLEICRHLKQDNKTQHVPVVMVTAKGEEADIVTGLELGADDYVTKPFSPRVLLARVRSVLRRRTRTIPGDGDPISIHGILIHPGRHEVVIDGQIADLTATEFRLLHLLARRPGWVFTRAQIVSGVHGDDYPVSDRSVDVQVVGLRKKLGPAGQFVETVRGVGYRLKEEPVRLKSFFGQIYLALILIAFLSVVAITWITSRSWQNFYLAELAGELEARARLVAVQVREKLEHGEAEKLDAFCKELGKLTDARLTVVLSDGRVAGDSQRDIKTMDNLGVRPEIRAALEGRVGKDQRLAQTQDMMFLAVPLMEQGKPVAVVRAALPLGPIRQALAMVYLKVALGSLGIILLGAGLSLVLSRRLTRPLEEFRRGAERFARGDLSLKLPRPDLAELVSLGETMNHMASQLDERIGTILRQRQEQEAVLASMVEGVIAVDSRSRVISLNRAAANLLGMDPAFVIQRSIVEVVENPDLQWFITRTLAASETIEGEITIQGDKPRFLQAHGTTLKDPRGKAFGVLIVVHDVTRLRQLENARRDFVANVSHELKTPVTSIKGFVETLLEGAIADPKHAGDFLKIIGRQADRLGAIIEDLLSLSRIEEEAEQGKIQLTGGKIKNILKAAIQVCNTRSEEKQIKVGLVCPEDLRARINGPLLEQAVINLIDNAVKYSGPGSAVQVEAGKENGQVVIRVADQGVGIAKEHLSRLFERFYRVDPSRSRKAGGTGLGLAIVKHIAQAHGGKVAVASTPGQGSTFAVFLQDDRGD